MENEPVRTLQFFDIAAVLKAVFVGEGRTLALGEHEDAARDSEARKAVVAAELGLVEIVLIVLGPAKSDSRHNRGFATLGGLHTELRDIVTKGSVPGGELLFLHRVGTEIRTQDASDVLRPNGAVEKLWLLQWMTYSSTSAYI
jgi:hypothetical protein